MDTLSYFVRDGVYRLKGNKDSIFICIPSAETSIGKLVQYKNNGKMYEKTGISYFLNCYQEDDIKSLFLNRDNYDMLGMIGNNFVISEDELYILEG